ncbi:PQQ-like beta-propeller repeat protein [Halobacteria archaeon AArc-m2/3/4]|uniref:PQQ-like beta-propeller repeat protein n=1 Tax=Natronoglomus mannanivorans TaxID=2979990 RepID=A0ABT2QE18_9EURY|nr:PQQ-like beta-propeller repeat protein [Halobacteria archaeon AArc-m2/3/4]
MNRRDVLARMAVAGVLGAGLGSGCLDASEPEPGAGAGDTNTETETNDSTGGATDDATETGDTTDIAEPVWSHDVGGTIDTVAHGTVFGREHFDDEDGDGGVFGLDVETGNQKWTYGQSGGYTMFTSFTVADALYFGFGTDAIGDGSGELYALEFDGTERWTRDVGSVYGRPIVDGDEDVVYAGSDDGVVRAFDTNDGTIRWRTDDLTGDHPAELTVVGVTDAVLVATGQLVALDPADGSVLWRYGDPDDRIRDATVVDGVAYLTDRDGLAAVAVDDGDERWRVDFDHNRWIQGIEAGRVFVEHQYDIHAFALEDGDELWTVSNTDRVAIDFHDDRTYIGTDQLSALEAEDGSERWSVPIDEDEGGGGGEDENEDDPIQSIQVVTDGESTSDGDDHSIFVQTDDTGLSRVDPDGEITWTATVDGRISNVVVDGDSAFVGSRDGIYSFSLDSS